MKQCLYIASKTISVNSQRIWCRGDCIGIMGLLCRNCGIWSWVYGFCAGRNMIFNCTIDYSYQVELRRGSHLTRKQEGLSHTHTSQSCIIQVILQEFHSSHSLFLSQHVTLYKPGVGMLLLIWLYPFWGLNVAICVSAALGIYLTLVKIGVWNRSSSVWSCMMTDDTFWKCSELIADTWLFHNQNIQLRKVGILQWLKSIWVVYCWLLNYFVSWCLYIWSWQHSHSYSGWTPWTLGYVSLL